MRPNERTIKYNTHATSEIESTWNERPKSTWPAYMLTCSLQALSHVSVTVPVYRPWHAPAKIKRGGHFGFLTGMWVFHDITLHRANNPAKSQAKVGLMFYFVESN